jgi:uncharacterized membrane protein
MEAKRGRRTAGERRKQLKEKEENAQLLLLFGDFLVTAIWVLMSSTFGEASVQQQTKWLTCTELALQPTALG